MLTRHVKRLTSCAANHHYSSLNRITLESEGHKAIRQMCQSSGRCVVLTYRVCGHLVGEGLFGQLHALCF